MCLERVTKTATLKNDRVGWKVFVVDEKGTLCGDCTGAPFNPGKNTAKSVRPQRRAMFDMFATRILSEAGTWYDAGFHLWGKKATAEDWRDGREVIVKVTIPAGTKVTYGKKRVAYGTATTIVAQTIIIDKDDYDSAVYLGV